MLPERWKKATTPLWLQGAMIYFARVPPILWNLETLFSTRTLQHTSTHKHQQTHFASFYRGRTLHYTGPNLSDSNRMAYIVNYRPRAMIALERQHGFDHLQGGFKAKEKKWLITNYIETIYEINKFQIGLERIKHFFEAHNFIFPPHNRFILWVIFFQNKNQTSKHNKVQHSMTIFLTQIQASIVSLWREISFETLAHLEHCLETRFSDTNRPTWYRSIHNKGNNQSNVLKY